MPSSAASGERVLLYSHDTFGLGHLRRTLAIAHGLRSRRDGVSQLVVTGSPLAHSFRLPEGADYLKLPSAAKQGADRYAARSLSLGLDTLLELRRDLLVTAAVHFRPDVLVVDNVPAGLMGELVPTLYALRRQGTRLVLGLRDIVDEPSVVRQAWTRQGAYRLLDEVYDAIVIYGDPDVYDARVEYGLSARAAAKTTFAGYLGRISAPAASRRRRSPLVLVTAGGGEDGWALLRTAADLGARMPGTRFLFVTGPFLPEARRRTLERVLEGADGARVQEFVGNLPAWIAAADSVVAMAGYNTVCEVLAAGRPAVLVPRVRPRREQLIRAEALRRRGLAAVVHPDGLTPETLVEALRRTAARPTSVARPVDLGGLERTAGCLGALLDNAPSAQPAAAVRA